MFAWIASPGLAPRAITRRPFGAKTILLSCPDFRPLPSVADGDLEEQPFEREVGRAGDDLPLPHVVGEPRALVDALPVRDLVAAAQRDRPVLPAAADRDAAHRHHLPHVVVG